MKNEKRYTILNTPVSTLSKKEFLPVWVETEDFQHVVTINAEMFVEAAKSKTFATILNHHTHNIPDSISVIWAGHYLNKKYRSKFTALCYGLYSLFLIPFNQKKIHDIFPERLSGADLFWDLIGLSNITNSSVFLLGAGKGVAREVEHIVQEKIPNIKIVGATSGGDPNKNASEIIEKINKSKAEVLFVALGAPKQEYWIHKHKSQLPHLKHAIGIGGTFDFIAGSKDIHGHFRAKRAPQKMRDLGLEWLWRLITQPFRFGRIKKAIYDFPKLVITHKMKNTA